MLLGAILLSSSGCGFVHLHFLILSSLNLLFGLFIIFLVTATALSLEVLTTSVGGIVFGLDATHFCICIFALSTFRLDNFTFDFALDFRGFNLRFFSTVGSLIVRGSIGFWLLGGELGGCGGIRVPIVACY
jgi:hypothetical protein